MCPIWYSIAIPVRVLAARVRTGEVRNEDPALIVVLEYKEYLT